MVWGAENEIRRWLGLIWCVDMVGRKVRVGGWVAGVRVLWKDSDTAMRPGAVCVGWHLPYSSNPVFLQLAGYYTSPFLFFFLSFLPSILTHFPTKGINNCLSPLVLSFFFLLCRLIFSGLISAPWSRLQVVSLLWDVTDTRRADTDAETAVAFSFVNQSLPTRRNLSIGNLCLTECIYFWIIHADRTLLLSLSLSFLWLPSPDYIILLSIIYEAPC